MIIPFFYIPPKVVSLLTSYSGRKFHCNECFDGKFEAFGLEHFGGGINHLLSHMLRFPTIKISPRRICIQHCACLAFVRLALHISTLTFTLAFRFLTCDIDFQAERAWAGWTCSASAFQISSESFDSIAVSLSFYFVLEKNEVIFRIPTAV